MSPTEPLWDSQQLADSLNVSVRTIEGWRLRGGGPPYSMVGGRPRYIPQKVRSWLEQHEQRNSSDKAA